MPRIYSKKTLGKDRVNGFYDTPLKTVKYMSEKVLRHYKPGNKILDPAVGDGVFLEYLHDRGVRKQDLYGYDIDVEKVEKLKKKFPNVRVFDATNPFLESFDFIIGNPPYNGDESHFLRENRSRLEASCIEIGAKNTFSIISYFSIKALNPGGMFVMILSDAFLTNIYYEPFRRFLLKSLVLNELLLAPRRLFHGKSADVRTCIISGKRMALELELPPTKNLRLVDRVDSEDSYSKTEAVEMVSQTDFHRYPNSSFIIGVPPEIRKVYLNAERRLGDVALGGTGISTGNDKVFLRRREEVESNADWVPYFKNGARCPYWYEPDFYIERDYRKNAKTHKTFMIRNEKYFMREGVTCSSVGVRFSAAYLPEGSLFGVNANFFFDNDATLFYVLGLLNSKLSWYFARRVLIRTNNISANYLRLMPYLEPVKDEKEVISKQVKLIVEMVKKGADQPGIEALQHELDAKFFKIFGISKSAQSVVLDFCANSYERL
jgi:adenine-specific DNA-methyltransferase